MEDISLSVDQEVIAAVRRYAAEQNSSVDALVRDYLTKLAAQFHANTARSRLRELSRRSQGGLGRKAWKRGDLHDRRAVS